MIETRHSFCVHNQKEKPGILHTMLNHLQEEERVIFDVEVYSVEYTFFFCVYVHNRIEYISFVV